MGEAKESSHSRPLSCGIIHRNNRHRRNAQLFRCLFFSLSPIGSITLYEWDFGDGTMKTTLEPYTNHCYASSGSFCGTLKVTNSQGTSTEQKFIGSLLEKNGGPLAMAAKSIEVSGVNDPNSPDLACNFVTTAVTPSQNPACVGVPVSFSATLCDFMPTSAPGTLSYFIDLVLINTVNVNDLGLTRFQ